MLLDWIIDLRFKSISPVLELRDPRTSSRGWSLKGLSAVSGHERHRKIGNLPTGYEPKGFPAGLSIIQSLSEGLFALKGYQATSA